MPFYERDKNVAFSYILVGQAELILFSFEKKGERNMIKENKFQSDLIKEIKERFVGCMVLKLDPNYMQGIPDLIILYGKYWATLECKRSESAPVRPNQKYYVDKMNKMSFSRFIYPKNKEVVLNAIQRAFKIRRSSRVS